MYDLDGYLIKKDSDYITKKIQFKGCHIIHKRDCDYITNPEDLLNLGYIENCKPAVEIAKENSNSVIGCKSIILNIKGEINILLEPYVI